MEGTLHVRTCIVPLKTLHMQLQRIMPNVNGNESYATIVSADKPKRIVSSKWKNLAAAAKTSFRRPVTVCTKMRFGCLKYRFVQSS